MTSKPVEEARHIQSARNITLHGLTMAQLRRVSDTSRKLRESLPDKHPLRTHFENLWLFTHAEIDRRELAMAEKKDKGEILWAFSHRRSWGDHTEIIRTPFRLIRRSVSHFSYDKGEVNESAEARLGKFANKPDWDFRRCQEYAREENQRWLDREAKKRETAALREAA